MRDLVVREGLQTMARDAAKLFRELIGNGEEIPYEVREPGDGSPLCRYHPQTERFIRDHASELRELDSFGASCAALEATDLTTPYLRDLGIRAPSEPRARAELTGIVFLCRLWLDSTDFSLDPDRLDAAIAELEVGGEATADEIDVVVPLRGFQMPVARLELATATIVRADTVDVPPEARGGEVMGASPWEPSFLAIARVTSPDEDEEETDEAGIRGADAFRRLITTLRLFRAGGVGLGPYAWVASGSNRWRRISTGAGKPRSGGYRLGEAELGDLVAFSRALASEDTPYGRLESGRSGLVASLGRAISRFEAGLERAIVLEALNDNLLALRFVLEGGGPADLGMPMRVAALCAEPDRRSETKAVVERAQALERELWSGEPHGDGPVPAETAVRLEELTRAILKDAACGHLGADLRSTADEILLADGLAVGDGSGEQRGATEEWDLSEELPELDGEVPEREYEHEDVDDAATPDESPAGTEADVQDQPTELLEAIDIPETSGDAEPVEAPSTEEPTAAEPVPGDPQPASERTPEPAAERASEPAAERAPELAAAEDPESAIEDAEEPPPRATLYVEPRIKVVKVPTDAGRTDQQATESPKEERHQMSFPAHATEAPRRAARTTAIGTVPEPDDWSGPEAERSDRSRGVPEGSPVLRLIEQTRSERRERADRLANLFPRTETEWNVREIGYDRTRRAKV